MAAQGDRNARLLECVEVIRALLRGEEVDHDGLGDRRPGEAVDAARRAAAAGRRRGERRDGAIAGGWADGLITINQPRAQLTRVIDAFRETAAAASRSRCRCTCRGPKPRRSAEIAHDQWRTNVFPPPLCWDLATVEQFDAPPTHVRPEDVHGPVLVSSDLAQHVAWIQELAAFGLDAVYLHHVGQEQRRFIDAFGEHVLPALSSAKATSDVWWKNAVVYCLDVETFLDSDGDGSGT